MEFNKVLSLLIKKFDENGVSYGLMGGFALFMLGIPRTTVDLDFLVAQDDLTKINIIMKKLGYRLVFQTENVSQYVNEISALGEIDFLHAFRKYALKMLEHAEAIKLGDSSIRVLRPEDVIGLKVQAIANDVTRRNRELADIESIVEKYSKKINWKQVREYFLLFDLGADFKILKEKYSNVK